MAEEEGTRPDVRSKGGSGGGLSSLFGGKSKPPYTSVLKSLETIGIEPLMMTVLIGEEPTQCLVVPTQDLVYKEWQYMSGSNYELKALGEEPKDEQS